MNGYYLAAIVGGVITTSVAWMYVACRLALNEDEAQRNDLARAGHPCQLLDRYQR